MQEVVIDWLFSEQIYIISMRLQGLSFPLDEGDARLGGEMLLSHLILWPQMGPLNE